MTNKLKLTPKVEEVLNHGMTIAASFAHKHVTSEHVFMSMLEVDDNIIKIFTSNGVDIDKMRKALVQDISNTFKKDNTNTKPMFSSKIIQLLAVGGAIATKDGSPVIKSVHVLMGMLNDNIGLVPVLLKKCRINIDTLYDQLVDISEPAGLAEDKRIDNTDDIEDYNEDHAGPMQSLLDDLERDERETRNQTTGALKHFSVNLNDEVKKGNIDKIIGRSDEIDLAIQTLMRRRKSNPILVGDPGVGKTAIVEGLAQKIVRNEVPGKLLKKNIYAIDMGRMIAGTQFRGQFEERLKDVVNDLKADPNAIGFIDEFHTIIGTGNGEGSLDAANLMKPALARGEMTLVTATTYDEYTKYVEKDGALSRRFQYIDVKEPSMDDTIEIINGIKDKYEDHHNIKYSEGTINRIVNLCNRYITDKKFPDKAIDIIDQVGAKSRSKHIVSKAFNNELEEEIGKLEDELSKIPRTEENKTKIFDLVNKMQEAEKKYEIHHDKYLDADDNTIEIEEHHVNELFSQLTSIPCDNLDSNSIPRLKTIEDVLRESVINQDDAIKGVSNVIKRSRVGTNCPKSPTGTFLFLGPTGVGKTQLTKALCKFLFETEDQLIRLDMSEYAESHTISKLIGSPPGYVGHGNTGCLTDKIRKNPYSVLLFDEIEKAHEVIHNSLLQILDEGRLTDSKGRTINFRNCVIIMTSNIGANKIQKNTNMGFLGSEYNDVKANVIEEVEKRFSPEFINRIDETIIFNHLTEENIEGIAEILCNELSERVKERELTITFENDVYPYLAEKGYDEKYGARPMKRAIKQHIESPLADFIINNDLVDAQTIIIGMNEEGEIGFKKIPNAESVEA